jgi:hypothetical protein
MEGVRGYKKRSCNPLEFVVLPKAEQQQPSPRDLDDRTITSGVLKPPLDIISISMGQSDGPHLYRDWQHHTVEHQLAERRPSRADGGDPKNILPDQLCNPLDYVSPAGHFLLHSP